MMCKAAGYETRSVKKLSVVFEVDKPIMFHIEFQALESNIEGVVKAFQPLISKETDNGAVQSDSDL